MNGFDREDHRERPADNLKEGDMLERQLRGLRGLAARLVSASSVAAGSSWGWHTPMVLLVHVLVNTLRAPREGGRMRSPLVRHLKTESETAHGPQQLAAVERSLRHPGE